jgi:hypothetical protein
MLSSGDDDPGFASPEGELGEDMKRIQENKHKYMIAMHGLAGGLEHVAFVWQLK